MEEDLGGPRGSVFSVGTRHVFRWPRTGLRDSRRGPVPRRGCGFWDWDGVPSLLRVGARGVPPDTLCGRVFVLRGLARCDDSRARVPTPRGLARCDVRAVVFEILKIRVYSHTLNSFFN